MRERGRNQGESRLFLNSHQPAPAETGTAVLVMRPFEEGALFRAVKGKPLPDAALRRRMAKELG
jgi:hypothetical protein